MNHISPFMRAVALFVAFLVPLGTAPVSLQAATFIWTQTGTGTLSWTTASNWSTAGQYVSSSANELMFYADSSTNIAAGTRNITTAVPATLSMNTLTLNGKGASSGASSSANTYGTSASTWTIGDGTTSTVNLNANFGATAAAGFNTTVAANLTLNQATTLFTGSGTGGFTFSGAIGEAAANYGITKSGTSAVTLSGAINFTGAILVSNGTMTLSNNTNSASTMTVNNGGTLILTGNNNPASGAMTVNTGGILHIGNNTATQFGPAGVYSGNISTGTGGTLRLWSTSAQTLSGIISGSGGINKAYGGTLTLSGSNTYTGKSQFIPQTTAGFTVNVSSFDYITTGDWANHGLGSSLGAPTTAANGTIDIGSGLAQAGVTLNYVSTATGETTDRVINLAFNGTSSQTIQASNSTGVLRFTSAFTSNTGTSGKLLLGGAGAGQIDQGLPQLPTGGLEKISTGTWTLGGTGSFTGGTTITDGTLRLSSATALQNSPFSTGSVVGGAADGLRIDTTTLTLGGLTGSNALRGRFTTALGGPSNATVQGGYDGLSNLTLNTVGGSTSVYTGAIVEGATGMSLTKSGAGIQTLNATHTYTGTTFVNGGGFLQLNGNNLTGGLSVSNAHFASNSTFAGVASVTSGGVISPGASFGAIGALNLTNATASALTLDASIGIFDLPSTVTTPDQIAVTGGLVVNNTNTVLLRTPTAGTPAGVYNLITSGATPTGAGSFVLANGSATRGNATVSVSGNNVILTVAGAGLAGTNNYTQAASAGGGTDTWNIAGNWAGGVPTGTLGASIPDKTSAFTVMANSATIPTYSGDLWIGNNVILSLGFTTPSAAIANALGTPGSTIIYMGANSVLNYRNSGFQPTMPAIFLTADAQMRFQESTNAATNPNFANSISGPFTFSLTSLAGNGFSTHTLNAANSFAGLNLAGASGVVNAAVSGSIGTANLTISGGGTVNLNHATAISDGANPIRINNGTLTYGTTPAAALTLSTRPIELNGTGQATINNNNTLSSSANILTLGGGISSTASGAKTLTLGGTNLGLNLVSGIISNGTGDGTVAVSKTGVGTWVLTNTNTYTGGTSLGGGTLEFATGALGSAGNITATASNTLRWASGNTTDISNRLVMANTFTTTFNTNGNDVEFASVIGSSTTGLLTKTGAGTLKLSASNTYTGATTVSNGTLRLNHQFATSTGTVTMNGGTAALVFDAAVTGDAFTLGGLAASASGTGFNILLENTTSDAVALTVGGNNASTIYAGALSGTGSLTKVGNGTLTLSGTNTFSGGLSINAGTLSVSNNNQLGDTSIGITLGGGRLLGSANITSARNVTVNGTGSSMRIPKNNNITTSGALLGSGAITFVDNGGSGTLSTYNLNSSGNTFTGAMSLEAVFVNVSSLGDALGNNLIFTGAGTFSLNSTGVIAGLMFNNRAIELSNTSATLSNLNATHAITIGSNLVATGAAAKTLTLDAVAGPINVFSGNITDGTGGGTVALTKAGAGTWALGGTNTYSGNTNLLAAASSRLVFRGSQSLSPNTKLIVAQNSGSVGNVRFLDDAPGTINFNRPIEFDGSAGGAAQNLAIFVGNNNTTNQGSSAGTTTGSTIQVGNITHTLSNSTQGSLSINVTGANSYRLRTGTLTLNNLTASSSATTVTTILNPTANMTVDAITMATGNITASDGIPVVRLDGTALDNIVTGAITNATDFATGHALSLQKQNTSIWVLSGTGSNYSGTTAITGGTLAGIGTNAFGNTTGISIAAASTSTLSLRGDTDTEFKRASDSVRYALTTTANGATIDVDAATGVTTAKTMTIGTLGLNNAVTNGTFFTGANNTSLSIGAVTTAAAASGTETLTNNIASTGSLTLASVAVTRTGTPTLEFTGTGSTIVSGAISQAAITALTKNGAGTLTLNGTNSSYTGVTTVNVGTLIIGANAPSAANGALGNASSEVVLGTAGGSADASILIGGAFDVARIIRIPTNNTTDSGTRVLTLGGNTAANSIFSGNIFLGTTNQAGRGVTLTAASGGQVTFSGVIQNPTGMDATAYTVTKSGLGTVVLSNTNTYTGATAVNQGTLYVNGSTTAGAVTVASGATLGGTGTIGGATTIESGGFYSPGSGVGTLNHSDSLTLDAGSIFNWENSTVNTLGSAGTDWDVTNITSGTLTLDNTATTGSKLRLQFTNASTDFTDAFWNTNQTWDFITGGVSGSNAFDATNISIWVNGVQQGSNNTITGQGTFTTIVNGSDERLVWTADVGGSIPTAYWAGASSGDWGTLNNWRDAASGGAVIGTAPSVDTDVHFSTTSPTAINLGAVNLGANFTVKTLAFDASSTAVTIGSSGGFVLTITPTSSANGINVDTTAGDSTLSVKVELGANQTWTVGANRTLTATGVVSGAFGLTKAGSGDLVLGGSNTYTGVTQINGGKLKINDLTNLGAGGVGNSVGIDGGTLQSTSNTYALGSNRSVLLGGSGGTIDTVSGGVTVDGIVSGTGSLTKSGAGILTLSATNTYTGNTNLNAGTINLGAAENAGVSGPLGNQAANAAGTIVMSGGTLQYSASNTFDYSGRFSTAGSQAWNIDTNGQNVAFATALVGASSTLTKLGTGILSLNGTNANTYNGTTTVTGGTLDLNKTAGVNAIAGNLTINGGTVRLQANEQIADTATITQTSGAFSLNGKTETIVSYNKTGGTFTTGRGGSLIGTGASITYDGAGSNQIEVDSSVVDGHVTLTNGATLDLAGANAPFDMGSPGTNGGILQINSGGTGLEMNGIGANTINLASDTNTTTAARIVLNDDVTTGGTGLNTIASTGVAATKGYVALGASGSRTFTVGDSVSGTGTDLDISAVLSSTGAGLTKAGAGTLATSAVNTYTGATSVDAGILQVGVAGVGSTHSSSAVTATSNTFTTATTGAGVNANNAAVTSQTVITAGPMIAGTGTINGDLTIGTNSSNVGVIRPGDVSGSSNGTLNIGGNLVVNDGSQLQMGLTSSGQNDAAFNWYVPTGGQNAHTYLTTVVTSGDYGTYWDSADGGYDSINVTGTLSLGTGGTNYPTLLASENGTFLYDKGDIFKLLDWSGIGHQAAGTISGGFNAGLPGQLVLPGLAAGFSWDTSALSSFGVVVVIPEPGRMMLLFFGLAALFLRRRRK